MSRVVTALDVGHDSIKLIAIGRGRDRLPEVVKVAWEPLGDLGRLEDGPEKSAVLRARVRRLAESKDIPVREVVAALSGRGTMLKYVQVPPVPPWRLEALMKFEASEAYSRSAEDGRSEGRIEQFIYSYRLLDTPDVDGQSTVLLALARESAALDCETLACAAGAEDPDIDLAALGLYSAYVYGHGAEEDEGKTVLLLDIGAEENNFVISRGGGLYFARSQNGGGNRFTKVLADALSVDEPAAEEYKRTKANLSGADADAPTEALRQEAVGLCRTVEGALLYARAQTRLKDLKIDRILLSGGGARVGGLSEFLASRLGVEVAPLEPLRKVSLGRLSSEELEPLGGKYNLFAIPVGLALARLAKGAATFDLRRPAARAARDFRRRTIYLRAAAAMFAAGLVFWVAGTFRDRATVARALEVAKARATSDESERKTLEAARARYVQLLADLGALRERVLSGEDLLRALAQVKKRTPDRIRLVRFSTSRPAVISDSKAKISLEDKDKGSVFQSERMIYLHGFSSSDQSLAKAYEQVTAYQRSLAEAKGLFEDVRQVLLRDARENAPGGPDVAEFVIAARLTRPR